MGVSCVFEPIGLQFRQRWREILSAGAYTGGEISQSSSLVSAQV